MLNGYRVTINDFIAFLIEFSFSILFLIIFCAIHYTLINKTKLNEKLNKSKMVSFWYFFGFGAILSLITFLVAQACALAINYEIGLPVIILGFVFAMSFFYNRSVQVGSIIPSVIWVLTTYGAFNNSFSWEWGTRLIIIGVMAVISIASTFIKWKKWPTYLISLVVLIGSMLGIIFGFRDWYLELHLIELAFAITSAVLFYWAITKINKFFNKMSYMAQSNLYTDDGFIIPSAIENEFALLIKKQNISQALVVTFYTEDPDIKMMYLGNKFRNKKSLLFKSQYDTYGVILTDNQYNITDIETCYLNNNKKKRLIPDPLAWLENEIKDSNVFAFVSVYGIHSNDINELIWFNQQAIKQFDKTNDSNKVQFFNSNLLNNQIKDELNYTQLIQKVNLDEITVQLEKVNINNKVYICPRYYWTKEFTCDINEILNKFNYETADTLLRHLAIVALETYSLSSYNHNNELLLFYPINELTNPFFATNQFIKKLSLYGVDKTNIVLSFDCKKMGIWSNTIINNLKELSNNGIKYMFIDLSNYYPLTLIKPECVLLDESIIQNKTKFNKMMSIAKTYKQNVLLSK